MRDFGEPQLQRQMPRVARALPSERVMTPSHSQVVVAYDFSHSGRAALYRAVALAKRAPSHVLHFVCALVHGEDYDAATRVQQALTDEIKAELLLADVTDIVHFFVHARIGKPAEEILELAHEVGADLIIVGSKGLTGVERLMLGSVSERVVREAHCTVEVARPKTYEKVELLVTVDSTEKPHPYVPPHRYTYSETRLTVRPIEWPLY